MRQRDPSKIATLKAKPSHATRLGPLLRESDAIPSLGEVGLNQFAPYLINRIAGQWNLEVQQRLRDYELTVGKMRALAVLSVIPSLSINELSVFTVTEQSTMSRTIDSMVEQGLISRRPQKDDARVREVELTSLGRDLFARYWPELYGQFSALFEGVSEQEFTIFVRVLHRLVSNQER